MTVTFLSVVFTAVAVLANAVRADIFAESLPLLQSRNPDDVLARQLTTKKDGSTTVDFETYEDGSDTQRGDTVDDTKLFAGSVVIRARRSNSDSYQDGMIFDTRQTTSNDTDLAMFRWFGNVLIISEDNDASNPKDAGDGGLVEVEFRRYPIKLNSIRFIDNEERGSSVTMLDEFGSKIRSVGVPTMTNGGQKLVTYANAIGVRWIRIQLVGSGAIDDINFFEFYSVPPTIAPTTTLRPTRSLRLVQTRRHRMSLPDGSTVPVGAMSIHPDGRHLAVGLKLPDSRVHEIRIYSFSSIVEDEGEDPVPIWIIRPQNRRFEISEMEYSPDGSQLAAADGFYSAAIEVWDTSSDYQSSRLFRPMVGGFGDRHGVRQFAWAQDSTHLASITGSLIALGLRDVYFWNVTSSDLTLESAQRFDNVLPDLSSERELSALDVSPDGRYLATGEGVASGFLPRLIDAYSVRLYEIEDRSLVSLSPPHSVAIADVRYSPDGTKLASYARSSSSNKRDEVYVWNVQSKARMWTFPAKEGEVFREKLSWSPDSRFLTISVVPFFLPSMCYIFDVLQGGEAVLVFEGGTCDEWSPDGKYILSKSFGRPTLFRIEEA